MAEACWVYALVKVLYFRNSVVFLPQFLSNGVGKWPIAHPMYNAANALNPRKAVH